MIRMPASSGVSVLKESDSKMMPNRSQKRAQHVTDLRELQARQCASAGAKQRFVMVVKVEGIGWKWSKEQGKDQAIL